MILMEERLDFAPCGYVSIKDDGTIVCINQTLLTLLDYKMDDVKGKLIYKILTKPSQSFYQLYFLPMITIEEKVEEMHLTLETKDGSHIPILLSAVRRKWDGIIVNECILFPMKQRHAYEQAMLLAKKTAEDSERSKKEALMELEKVQKELENKQTELLQLNEKLQKLAMTDELTSLYNRRIYKRELTENLSIYKKTRIPFSLLMVDIDYFKDINDTYGHVTGDQILKALAQMLVTQSRKQDVVARYGGEEFAIILTNTTVADSIQIAERIRKSVEEAIWDISSLSLTISAGIATSREGDTRKIIQTRADEALYRSKHNGRNQITHASQLERV